MKLYVSGPMSGIEDHNFPAFRAATRALRAAGFDAFDPGARGVIDGWEWADYLRHDLRDMLTCDGVALLPGWKESRGACLEYDVALRLGIPARSVTAWLSPAYCRAA